MTTIVSAMIGDGTNSIEYKIPKLEGIIAFMSVVAKDLMIVIVNKTKGTKEVHPFDQAFYLFLKYREAGDVVEIESLDNQAAKVLYGKPAT